MIADLAIMAICSGVGYLVGFFTLMFVLEKLFFQHRAKDTTL